MTRSPHSRYRAHSETAEALACDIPASLNRLIADLSPGEDGAARKLRALYIWNIGTPASQHRGEDRSDRVLERLKTILEQAATLPASHVEAHLVRAAGMVNDFQGDPQEVEFATLMLSQHKLFNAVRAQKAADELPVAALVRPKSGKPRRRTTTERGPVPMPEMTMQVPAAAVPTARRKR